ncbi:MAG: EAL domain-containing protein [Rhodobacteraceae bacterium]|jgi:EAL domain-containing protein (putative c-di-GMP-specific phosphodiesterase class I)|nr:EAL domain-containing protein [Paracoccaceae bacterium]
MEDGLGSPLSAALAEGEGRILDRVADAVRERRLRLAYQPVVVARSPQRIGFHEGLIRLLDPGGQVIPAREFIRAVEPHALGRDIDCAALAIGLDALVRHPDLRLSINMSARSVGWPRWLRLLRTGLAREAGLGERLILEISEASAMTVPELLAGLMAELRPKGIAFALDGFGAGPITLRHFRDLHFDMMKIDAGFTRGVAGQADNQVMMSACLALARQFDMLTVAQGVETAAEAQWLAALGVDCLQGHHFGVPKLYPHGL